MLAPVDLEGGVIRNEIGIFSGSRIHYGGTNLSVMADALLPPEVFTNLIGNSIKFGGGRRSRSPSAWKRATARSGYRSRIPGRGFPMG
ncbi:hypothetical protein [Methanoculleus chikugoensis]|uniref:hypothetical protein n=1 Tax=Methanoculleus chikugoensis TaxID=118126 RepID=UPI0006D22BC2|nr:hypothetical protein [Methanoculleus chikugoensis]